MIYVRFKFASNQGFEVEVDHFVFSPLTGYIYLWKGVFDIPRAVSCNQFVEFSIIEKNDVGINYTFYRDYKSALKINNIVCED